MTVAAVLGNAGGDEIAHAGQAPETLSLAAELLAQACQFGHAARHQGAARVVAEIESVEDAGGDGDDVLDRAAELDAHDVGAAVGAEAGGQEVEILQRGGGELIARGQDDRGRNLTSHPLRRATDPTGRKRSRPWPPGSTSMTISDMRMRVFSSMPLMKLTHWRLATSSAVKSFCTELHTERSVWEGTMSDTTEVRSSAALEVGCDLDGLVQEHAGATCPLSSRVSRSLLAASIENSHSTTLRPLAARFWAIAMPPGTRTQDRDAIGVEPLGDSLFAEAGHGTLADVFRGLGALAAEAEFGSGTETLDVGAMLPDHEQAHDPGEEDKGGVAMPDEHAPSRPHQSLLAPVRM